MACYEQEKWYGAREADLKILAMEVNELLDAIENRRSLLRRWMLGVRCWIFTTRHVGAGLPPDHIGKTRIARFAAIGG